MPMPQIYAGVAFVSIVQCTLLIKGYDGRILATPHAPKVQNEQ